MTLLCSNLLEPNRRSDRKSDPLANLNLTFVTTRHLSFSLRRQSLPRPSRRRESSLGQHTLDLDSIEYSPNIPVAALSSLKQYLPSIVRRNVIVSLAKY